MDDIVFDDILKNGSYWSPKNGHRAIEIYSDAGSAVTHVQESSILAGGISSLWADKKLGPGPPDPPRPGLRLLICHPRVLDQDIWPLPVPPDSLKALLDRLEIPTMFPRAICHQIPLATSFQSFRGTGRRGLVLRTNLSHQWQYALALTHDAREQLTTAVVLGLQSEEVNEILATLRQVSPKELACPVTLPCLLMDKALAALVKDAENRRRSLTQISQQISGMHGFHGSELTLDQGRWDREEVDLDQAMQMLTGMADVCAGIAAVCKMQYDFVEVLAGFLAAWDPARERPVSRETEQRLKFFRHFLLGIESKVSYIKESVNGQVQTIYTLISQRESKSQVALAQTSRRLAELTQKDSTDMRIIAAVTLIFLPATFTSTFFSTSFFDFSPAGSAHVSTWIWLYAVLTVVLTLLVLCLWLYTTRLQQVKAQLAIRRQSKRERPSFELPSRATTASLPKLSTITSRVQVPRPYLSGSEVFEKRMSIFDRANSRAETFEVSPTDPRRGSIFWGPG